MPAAAAREARVWNLIWLVFAVAAVVLQVIWIEGSISDLTSLVHQSADERRVNMTGLSSALDEIKRHLKDPAACR